jgi:hypothetical protein
LLAWTSGAGRRTAPPRYCRRYNSGLFHFRDEKGREESPDHLTLDLELEDGPLKNIIRRLY